MADALALSLQYVQVIGIPIIGAIIAGTAAMVAFQQMRIARTKLNHDLYDRRYKLFDVVRNYITEIITKNSISIDESKKYLLGIGDAEFLFDKNIVSYLKEIGDKGSLITIYNETLPSMPTGPARSDIEHNRAKELDWMNQQTDVLVNKFRPFLALDQRQSSLVRLYWDRIRHRQR